MYLTNWFKSRYNWLKAGIIGFIYSIIFIGIPGILNLLGVQSPNKILSSFQIIHLYLPFKLPWISQNIIRFIILSISYICLTILIYILISFPIKIYKKSLRKISIWLKGGIIGVLYGIVFILFLSLINLLRFIHSPILKYINIKFPSNFIEIAYIIFSPSNSLPPQTLPTFFISLVSFLLFYFILGILTGSLIQSCKKVSMWLRGGLIGLLFSLILLGVPFAGIIYCVFNSCGLSSLIPISGMLFRAYPITILLRMLIPNIFTTELMGFALLFFLSLTIYPLIGMLIGYIIFKKKK